MDAITYLVGRNSKPASRIGLGLLLASVLVILNQEFVNWFGSAQSALVNQWPVSWAYGLMSWLTQLAMLFLTTGVLVGLPIYLTSRVCNTLISWSENRVLDELTSTGLTHRYLLDQLLRHYLGRWIQIAVPSTVLGAAVLHYNGVEAMWPLLYCNATALALFAGSFCTCCWKIACQDTGWRHLLFPMAIKLGIPAVVVLLLEPRSYYLASCLYVSVASYGLAHYAMARRAEFNNASSKFRRWFTIKRERSKPLSENAIVARQEMRGREVGDLLYPFAGVVLLSFSYLELFTSGRVNLNFVYVVLLGAGLLAGFRAAAKLSQSITQEMEGSTMELLRTTPMGSESFLEGWLDLTLRPLYAELILLSVAATPLIVISSPGATLNGTFPFVLFVTLAAPYLGALFGASTAGQCKPRHEISGQISGTMALFAVLGLPQMLFTLSVYENSWGPLVFSALGLWFFAWALKAGAHKSLNRVFLPQK